MNENEISSSKPVTIRSPGAAPATGHTAAAISPVVATAMLPRYKAVA